MASGIRRDLGPFFAAAMLCGALHAESVNPEVVAQYQPRPAQLPAAGDGASRPTRPDNTQAVQPRGSGDDCKRRWLEYERSQACFARFRTVLGIKPQAYDACGKELLDPSAECGPPTSP